MSTNTAGLTAGLLILLAGCGGGGGGGTGTGPTPARIQVGGQYSTAVTLTDDTCGGTHVMPLPTSVTHTPGETRFTLTHGGTTYNGTLSLDGSFRTDSLTVTDSAGAAHTILIEGRFATQGFDANVTVSVLRTSTPTSCRYAVHWVGTKQGGVNVIP